MDNNVHSLLELENFRILGRTDNPEIVAWTVLDSQWS